MFFIEHYDPSFKAIRKSGLVGLSSHLIYYKQMASKVQINTTKINIEKLSCLCRNVSLVTQSLSSFRPEVSKFKEVSKGAYNFGECYKCPEGCEEAAIKVSNKQVIFCSNLTFNGLSLTLQGLMT